MPQLTQKKVANAKLRATVLKANNLLQNGKTAMLYLFTIIKRSSGWFGAGVGRAFFGTIPADVEMHDIDGVDKFVASRKTSTNFGSFACA